MFGGTRSTGDGHFPILGAGTTGEPIAASAEAELGTRWYVVEMRKLGMGGELVVWDPDGAEVGRAAFRLRDAHRRYAHLMAYQPGRASWSPAVSSHAIDFVIVRSLAENEPRVEVR